jgi:hypothetical protein
MGDAKTDLLQGTLDLIVPRLPDPVRRTGGTSRNPSRSSPRARWYHYDRSIPPCAGSRRAGS